MGHLPQEGEWFYGKYKKISWVCSKGRAVHLLCASRTDADRLLWSGSYAVCLQQAPGMV